MLVFTGCATTDAAPARTAPTAAARPSAGSTGAKPASKVLVVCENESPTGSHLSKRVCRPVDQADRDRAATQIDLLRPRATPQLPP